MVTVFQGLVVNDQILTVEGSLSPRQHGLPGYEHYICEKPGPQGRYGVCKKHGPECLSRSLGSPCRRCENTIKMHRGDKTSEHVDRINLTHCSDQQHVLVGTYEICRTRNIPY
jgi:hypothetical protein